MTDQPDGPPNLSFNEIHEQERKEIAKRRAKHSYDPSDRDARIYAGLALSGGGIRSATFCLGFLQELQRLRLLRIFDYLSTVSGGGYLGGWWSAWLSRSEESLKDIDSEPLFTARDIHHPVSLLIKISEAEEPVALALQHQLKNDELGRRFLGRLGTGDLSSVSSELTAFLVFQLNSYISQQYQPVNKAPANQAELEAEERRKEDVHWQERVRLIETFPYELRGIFPPSEKIEPNRTRSFDERTSDGSLCAWEDPIHHLRLFANYLTPRKGILSADTWRAISVITRNLSLTWLILLPLLIGLMLLGQAYFLLNDATRPQFLNPEASPAFGAVFIQIMIPIGVLLISSVLMAIAWLLCNRDNSSSQDFKVQTACVGALAFLLFYALSSMQSLKNWFDQLKGVKHFFFSSLRYSVPAEKGSLVIQLRLIVAWVVVVSVSMILMWFWKLDERSLPAADTETLSRWRRDVRRARFSQAQARLLVTTAAVSAVLLLSWISCLLARDNHLGVSWKIPFALVPLLSAIGGSIFTAVRATPITSSDRANPREPSLISRLIFAITPPLVVCVLAVIAAWFSHGVLVYYSMNQAKNLGAIWDFLKLSTFLSIGLCMGLALYEMQDLRWSKILRLSLAPVVFICLLLINLSWAGQAIYHYKSESNNGGWGLIVSAALGALITGHVFRRVIPKGKWKWRLFRRLNLVNPMAKGTRSRHLQILKKLRFGSTLAALVLFVVLSLVGYLIGNALHWVIVYRTPGLILRAVVVTLIAIAGGGILFRLLITRSNADADNVIELHFLNEKSFGKRPEALWLAASFCSTIPLVLLSLAHYAVWRGRLEMEYSRTLILFPVVVGLLFLFMMLLRSLVIQKLLASHQPITSWAGGIFDWLLNKIPRVQKHCDVVYQLLALAAVCLTPVIDLSIRALSAGKQAAAMTITPMSWSATTVALFVSLPVFGVSIFQIPPRAGLYEVYEFTNRRFLHSKVFLWTLAGLCIACAFLGGLMLPEWLTHISEVTPEKGFTSILLPLACGCCLIVLFEVYWARSDNRRSLYLVAFAYATIAAIFFIRLAVAGPEWYLVPGLLAAICVWVGALGWMVDPNAVSMHQFYKSRLVRAYLGASNVRRLKDKTKEITETVAGDDVQLRSLRNCARGGPYHLINTTLNLVAGRDLATAQRSASSFVLSQEYCGAPRTNYCATEQYMNGQLTLGTAIAASGAAISPNMGAKKPTAALAMLMTLLNVRLGYWAPTPNRDGWNSSQPRLWPFYLVREFLSQTNDLSDYCYLTDGGHFDNTGLYSLIERGCRYVVLVDCGADPKPSCFQDFGEAIRRCRIDFGTEIELSLDPFIYSKCGQPEQCYAVGKIYFSKEHMQSLGHAEESLKDLDSRTGTIVYFKPAVMESVTPDVRQYAIENKNFPQQSTANQWFDEAQFESYRRLGQLCAKNAFGFRHVLEMSKSARMSLHDIEKLFSCLLEGEKQTVKRAPLN
jgi:hypothetical protein